jgi:nicotinate-nucleotide adenylyltransferase
MFRRIVTEPIELSSTQIRKRVAEGKSIEGLVPQKVEKFIRDNRLYVSEEK